MAYQRKDTWYRRAKQEGYRSRSAYKLQEIDQRLRLFRPGQRVLDLGCAPGGWLQVAAERVGARGRVVGIDLEPVTAFPEAPQTCCLQGDIFAPDTPERLAEALGGPADVVLSDMAPHTSGDHDSDHARSLDLVRAAGALATGLLRGGGWLVAKVFEGPDLNALIASWRDAFADARRLHLDTSRRGSREVYLVARRKTAEKPDSPAHRP